MATCASPGTNWNVPTPRQDWSIQQLDDSIRKDTTKKTAFPKKQSDEWKGGTWEFSPTKARKIQ
eukprot:7157274-Ditylum_brightwellii.AAC.1